MLREKLEELIDDLNEGELIELWNEYCSADYRDDDKIYYMDELDDFFYCSSASEIIDRLHIFSTSDEYFQDTCYGLDSFSYASDKIEVEVMIDYIIDNECCLYNDDIKKLLEGVDEYEDEPDAP